MNKLFYFLCISLLSPFQVNILEVHSTPGFKHALSEPDNPIYFVSSYDSRSRDLYVMTPDGNELRKISNYSGSGHYPHYNNVKLSPDGKKLVFQIDPGRHDFYSIWTMNVDESGLKKITADEGLYPNWSPDGNTIVFSGRRNGVWEMITIPATGGVEKIISHNRQNSINPGWGATASFHPDGKSIVYAYVREKVLYSYDLETSGIRLLRNDGSYLNPVFSKNGAMAVNRSSGAGGYDLVVIDGDSESVISTSVISYSAPDWFANDSKLLFAKSVNGKPQVFGVDLKTKSEVQLTNNNSFTAMPVSF